MNGSQTSIITSMQTVDITELPEGNYEAYVLAIASVSSATAPSLPSTTVFFTVNPCKDIFHFLTSMNMYWKTKLLWVDKGERHCEVGISIETVFKSAYTNLI